MSFARSATACLPVWAGELHYNSSNVVDTGEINTPLARKGRTHSVRYIDVIKETDGQRRPRTKVSSKKSHSALCHVTCRRRGAVFLGLRVPGTPLPISVTVHVIDSDA